MAFYVKKLLTHSLTHWLPYAKSLLEKSHGILADLLQPAVAWTSGSMLPCGLRLSTQWCGLVAAQDLNLSEQPLTHEWYGRTMY